MRSNSPFLLQEADSLSAGFCFNWDKCLLAFWTLIIHRAHIFKREHKRLHDSWLACEDGLLVEVKQRAFALVQSQTCCLQTYLAWLGCDGLIYMLMYLSWLGKPSCKKSAVFFNIVHTGGWGDQTHVQKLYCKFCTIQRALWQHKLRHRKDV